MPVWPVILRVYHPKNLDLHASRNSRPIPPSYLSKGMNVKLMLPVQKGCLVHVFVSEPSVDLQTCCGRPAMRSGNHSTQTLPCQTTANVTSLTLKPRQRRPPMQPVTVATLGAQYPCVPATAALPWVWTTSYTDCLHGWWIPFWCVLVEFPTFYTGATLDAIIAVIASFKMATVADPGLGLKAGDTLFVFVKIMACHLLSSSHTLNKHKVPNGAS